MSVLLVGDAHEDYTDSTSPLESPIFQNAFSFVAVGSGPVEELWLRTNGETNTCTSVLLGIFPDNGTGLAPTDTLLASVEVAGTPPTDSWIGGTVTGTATIVEGETYWLASRGRDGTLHFNCLADGGLGRARANTESPDFITWGTSFSELSSLAPIGFKALGTPPAPIELRDSGLEWHITGLWYPGETSVDYFGRVADPSDGQVEIPLDNARTAHVTLSVNDPAAASVPRGKTYQRCLRAYYRGHLVFWGPINLREVDFAAETITLSAVDPSLRLQHHQLRRGDLVIGEGASGGLTAANHDHGQVPVDHTGLRLLRDAGKNTPEQSARGVPDLGIDDGTNTFVATPFNLIGVTRGDQVWNDWIQLSQSLGPDFELEPVEDVVGAYCKLNTYSRQGSDISARVALHWGTGKDNLENIREKEGAKYTTHVHVLPRDEDGQRRYRFTQANAQASKETGPYVDWDATDYDSTGIAPDDIERVLRAYGDEVLAAYSRPLQELVLTLPPEDATSYLYLRDYNVGDTIAVAGRSGLVELDSSYFRITTVRLQQDDAENTVRPELQVIADAVAELGDTVGSADPGDD